MSKSYHQTKSCPSGYHDNRLFNWRWMPIPSRMFRHYCFSVSENTGILKRCNTSGSFSKTPGSLHKSANFRRYFKNCSFSAGTEPDDIAQGLMDLLGKKDILNSKVDLQDQWIKTHSWISLTRRLENIIKFFTLDCCWKN